MRRRVTAGTARLRRGADPKGRSCVGPRPQGGIDDAAHAEARPERLGAEQPRPARPPLPPGAQAGRGRGPGGPPRPQRLACSVARRHLPLPPLPLERARGAGRLGRRRTRPPRGPEGEAVALGAGDVLVLPAGTGHCLLDADSGFEVVGAYPPDQDWDICREAPDAAALERIRAAPFPRATPWRAPKGPCPGYGRRPPKARDAPGAPSATLPPTRPSPSFRVPSTIDATRTAQSSPSTASIFLTAMSLESRRPRPEGPARLSATPSPPRPMLRRRFRRREHPPIRRPCFAPLREVGNGCPPPRRGFTRPRHGRSGLADARSDDHRGDQPPAPPSEGFGGTRAVVVREASSPLGRDGARRTGPCLRAIS